MFYNMNMNEPVIKNDVIVTQEIKKSKFISYLFRIQDEAQAKDLIKQIKKEHPKANHHCTAYRVGQIERSNDDGEPASSAGLPMLQVLKGIPLDQVLAIVVRYFGGTELGVGGLIRAYGSSVSLAIEATSILKAVEVSTYHIKFPYRFINDIEVHFNDTVIERQYVQEDAIYTVDLEDTSLLDDMQDITQGNATVTIQHSVIKYK